MKTPPIACRRAVRPLQSPSAPYIWVSDELLVLAYRRFLRSICPRHHKRYGSSVPGPLEARRRAAKRRITDLASYPSANAPPSGFSLAMLFGGRPKNPQKFRYEPPTLLKAGQPLEPSLVPPMTGSSSELDSLFPSLLRPQSPHPDVTSHVSSKDEPVTVSKVEALQEVKTEQKAASANSSSQVMDQASRPEMQHAKDMRTSTKTPSVAHVNFGESITRVRTLLKDASQVGPSDCKRLISDIKAQYPKGALERNFTLAVLKSFLDTPIHGPKIWHHDFILTFLSDVHIPLPRVETNAGVEFVNRLSTISPKTPKTILMLHAIYQKLMSGAVNKESPLASYKDVYLTEVYRVVWENTLASPMTGSSLRGTKTLERLEGIFETNQLGEQLRMLRQHTNAFGDTIVKHVQRHSTLTGNLSHGSLLLNCIPLKLLHSSLPDINENLLRKCSESPNGIPLLTNTWLRLLSSLDNVRKDSGVWLELHPALNYESLAKVPHGIRPADVGQYLAQLQPHIFIKTVMTWIPNISMAQGPNQSFIKTFVETYHDTSFESREQSRFGVYEMLAKLILRMEEQKIPIDGFLRLVVELIWQHMDPGGLAVILQRLRANEVKLNDLGYLQELAWNQFSEVTESDQPYMFQIWQLAKGIEAEAKVDASTNWARYQTAKDPFTRIVQFSKSQNILPDIFRNVPIELLRKKDVEVIHRLAHHISLDYSRTAYQAWRNIYILARYLADNELPVGTMFTKAIVRAALMRPLMENRFVSSRRLGWVCRWVAKAEGEDEARKIDYTFWVWRGQLILHAKRRLHDVGGHGTAHVNTMKRLGLI